MKLIHSFLTHKGEYYEVYFTKFKREKDKNYFLGLCDPPDEAGAKIRIDERLKDKELARICIHELIHSFNFDASEKCVDKCANTIITLLRKLGYDLKRNL